MGTATKRERLHPSAYKFVRRVKGRRYQARLWVGERNGGSVNLGLYPSEWAAGQAVQAVLAALRGGPTNPVTIWRAMAPAIADGTIPAHVLPKYVFRGPAGYMARTGRGRGAIVLGPFADPEAACRAMLARLAALGER